MGWIIAVVIVVGIIAILVIVAKKDAAEADVHKMKVLSEIDESNRRSDEADDRRRRLALEILGRLPVEDPDSSPLLHEPVYDCSSDDFELPCANPNFALDFSSNNYSIGRIRSTEEMRETVASQAACRPDLAVAVVDGKRYLAIVYTDHPSEPGGKVWRWVRTGPEEWFCWYFRAGMRGSAVDVDPSFMVADLSKDPGLWPRLLEETRAAREGNSNFRYSLKQCSHRV